MTYTSTSGNSLFGYTDSYGFTPDILWSGTPMIGLNAGRGTVTLSFATPLSGFLAEIDSTQYASTSDAIITAYDLAGDVLDSILFEHNGYQVEPGYMGFSYATAEISRITFANEYIGLRNISILSADQIGPVPEATTWGMMIVGFGMAGTALRRARRVRPQAA
ncbi:PEPxxWA-CTERM sorting domain-containing protein [Sphingomonas nostoxanthinifaciens]|nr:PEPxxWA-CTERM sorting domain-containing protein [Sphingomonas nostoxanthinifaciens]